MRVAFALAVAWSLVSVAAAEQAEASIRKHTEISAQELGTALKNFAEDRGLAMIYRAEVVSEVNTGGAKGELTLDEGLRALLSGTGLTYKFLDEKTVTIVREGDKRAEVRGERALKVAQGEGSEDAAAKNPQETEDAKLEEIVVTAQKRGEERLQDIPVPISVLPAQSLLQNGATGLQDYFSKVPGVALVSGIGGTPAVLIRGVGINGVNDNPTVGVTTDDAPFGSSTYLGGGLQPIDMDPNELKQIEVLRGPQGTLYGASSIGGLLRYVMVEPSMDELSGRVMMSTQSSRNNNGLDYALRGSVNLPLSSSVALRVSGFDRSEAGFIDDTFSGQEGINDGHSYGGRAALLWRANEDWSVKLSAVRQQLSMDAANIVNIDPSEEERLETSDYIPNGNGGDRSVTFLMGLIEGRVSGINLTSISAYTRSDSVTREGFTRELFPFLAQLVEPSADAAILHDNSEPSKFSQEFRAQIPLSGKIDWLVGAFYTEEKGDYLETISSALRGTGETLGNGDVFNAHSKLNYSEIAAFTNLTVRFTDRFDVQFGGRLSQNHQSLDDERGGFILGGGPFFRGPVKSTDDPFTYLITPRFKLTDDWMVYSRVASGYRAGGPTFNAVVPGAPAALEADTTENYEVGIKGDLFERKLSIDASAYYIDWKNIPVGVRPDPDSIVGYNVNAGGAISKGLELSFDLRPLRGLTFSAWGAWSDAYISELPATTTVSFGVGDRLPYSPHFSGNATIDYEHPLFDRMSGNVGTSVRYVGDRVHSIGLPANLMKAYTQVDAYAGLKSGTWTVNAFVNNLTDERGRIGDRALDISFDGQPTAVLIIRPRTIGLSIAKDF